MLRQQPARAFDGGADAGESSRADAKKSARSKPVEFEQRTLQADESFKDVGLSKV